ncbi:MAG: FxsA family protein [Kordiimonadaceae bacterium]|nr:FxsA family protein [Kordiimonadaceae bacterium]
MAFMILLLFIAAPIIELSLLIDVGGEIGAVPTVLLCLLTAGIGMSLVRLQGMAVLKNMQTASQSGRPVGESLIHGFFLLIAGICLFIPGFITDSLGALLLIPFIRLFLGKAGLAQMVVRMRTTGHSNPTEGPSNFQDAQQTETPSNPHVKDSGGLIIDGEFQDAGNSREHPSNSETGSKTDQPDERNKKI